MRLLAFMVSMMAASIAFGKADIEGNFCADSENKVTFAVTGEQGHLTNPYGTFDFKVLETVVIYGEDVESDFTLEEPIARTTYFMSVDEDGFEYAFTIVEGRSGNRHLVDMNNFVYFGDTNSCQ